MPRSFPLVLLDVFLPDIVFPCDGRESLLVSADEGRDLFWKFSFYAGVVKGDVSLFPWLAVAFFFLTFSFLAMDANASSCPPTRWETFFWKFSF